MKKKIKKKAKEKRAERHLGLNSGWVKITEDE